MGFWSRKMSSLAYACWKTKINSEHSKRIKIQFNYFCHDLHKTYKFNQGHSFRSNRKPFSFVIICRIIFCITKVRSPEQFLKYHFVRVLRADENLDFARSCMIIFNPYWIIKCPDVPLSLSFPRSFDHSGFCDVKCHFFDTNVCSVRHFVTLAPLRVVPVWRAKVFIRRKVFPLSRVTYPTCRGEATRPPEVALLPETTRGHSSKRLFKFTTTQGKVNSPRVSRGQGCFGYPRPHKRGLNLAGTLWWSRDASCWSEEILMLWATLNKNVNQAPQIFPPSIRLDDNEMSSRMKN